MVMTDRGPVPEYWRLSRCIDCTMTIHRCHPTKVRCRGCQRKYRKQYAAHRNIIARRKSSPMRGCNHTVLVCDKAGNGVCFACKAAMTWNGTAFTSRGNVPA